MANDDLVKRLDAYFVMGGLFNPELADHQAVSDLLKDCREAITRLTNERNNLIETVKMFDAEFGRMLLHRTPPLE
jgi:TRAP-type uncharacterized transport system substrate-binding protein